MGWRVEVGEVMFVCGVVVGALVVVFGLIGYAIILGGDTRE